ncbi:hypothetical protein [Aeromicrobium sp. NPDC092404]|uniref:hypothetical protein n=1 Tax=Aeromicrobium sp. NPDC092404 TaxID=3154976 RepID=UPI003431B901
MKIAATLLACVLVLAGCGGSDEPDPDVPTTSVADQQAEQAEQLEKAQEDLKDKVSGTVVAIVIQDGKVVGQGKRVKVKVGAPISLNIRSDADEEIHVHSDPEHTYQVKAGEPLTEQLTIDTPGQVAVEAHHLDVTIVQLVVEP